MKVNYTKLLEYNKEAMTEHGQASAYQTIQTGVELYLWGDTLTEQHKNLLLELGVLELTEEEKKSKSIVGPFKFNGNGDKETY